MIGTTSSVFRTEPADRTNQLSKDSLIDLGTIRSNEKMWKAQLYETNMKTGETPVNWKTVVTRETGAIRETGDIRETGTQAVRLYDREEIDETSNHAIWSDPESETRLFDVDRGESERSRAIM